MLVIALPTISIYNIARLKSLKNIDQRCDKMNCSVEMKIQERNKMKDTIFSSTLGVRGKAQNERKERWYWCENVY